MKSEGVQFFLKKKTSKKKNMIRGVIRTQLNICNVAYMQK